MYISKHNKRRLAFTLIELLIVIVVIAILALIVIGRLLSATRKTREARMHDNLRTMRGAIETFEGHTGEYPGELTDLVARTRDDLSSAVSEVAKGLYQGPYLTTTGGIQIPNAPGLPSNPFVLLTDTNVEDHWLYDNTTGIVRSAIVGETLLGLPYSEL